MADAPRILLLALLTGGLTACIDGASDDGSPSDLADISADEVAFLTVTQAGGVLRHPLATVEIPARAFGERDGTISVGPATDDLSDYDNLGMPVRIEVTDGQLERPLRVILAAPEEGNPQGLKVWSTFDGGGYTARVQLAPLPGATGSALDRLDPDTLTIEVEHDATAFLARSGISSGVMPLEPAAASLLFVVSDSPHMQPKQDALVELLGPLLDDLQPGPLDARVAVASAHCENDGSCGVLLEGDGYMWVDNSVASPVLALSQAIEDVGIEDLEDEGTDKGFKVFELAFGPSTENIQGDFLNASGQLDVIFLSDRNDLTDNRNRNPADVVDVLKDLTDHPGDARFHAIAGQQTGQCDGALGNARSGRRYRTAAELSGGYTTLSCHDFSHTLHDIVSDLRATDCTPLPFPGHGYNPAVELHPSGAPLPPDMYDYNANKQCLTVYQSAYIAYPDQQIAVRYQIHED